MSRGLAVGILSVALGIVLAGCGSTATPKPDAQAAPGSDSMKKPVSKSTPVKSAGDLKSGSSLDAHREGVKSGSGPLREIYFEFDRYDLTSEARATLQAHAVWLKANPSGRVEIEGHCDERGTSEYNLALGAKRAQAARDYLSSLGVSLQRMSTISYGEELPVCRQQTEECYRMNRRDRFVITPRPTA